MKLREDPILGAFRALAVSREGEALVAGRGWRATAGEIDRLADRAVETIEAGGPLRCRIVGLSAVNGSGFLAGLLALRRAGCAALLLDPLAPALERRWIAIEMGAAGVLECELARPRTAADLRFVRFDPPSVARGEPVEDIAVIKLSSGSTGRARGILTPSEALVADDAALAASMGLRADERILGAIPMSHSYGLSSVVMPALTRGSTIVVADEAGPFGPLRAARREGVTFLPTSPAFLGALVRMAAPPSWPESLRLAISAGAPLSPETARRFRETFGSPVHVFYGASECGGICYDREGSAAEDGTVGAPVEGVRITLEEEGAVIVESPAVARGYIPTPDEALGGGRFRSGDLACFRGGNLVLRGRLDDLIIVKGRNVNPREVEDVLVRASGVEEAAAVGVRMENGSGPFVGAVVAGETHRLEETELRAWCRRHLADYKVPRSFVLVDELPRTGRGKVDRTRLLELAGRNEEGSEGWRGA